MRRAFATLGLAALVLLCAGCKVATTVAVTATANGHGSISVTVDFDQAAVAAIGGESTLASELADTDLVAAGWRVSRPRRARDGSVSVTASHSFSSFAEAGDLVGEVAGAPGGATRPFAVTLTRRSSFWHTETTLSGTVNLSCGTNCFGDSGLQALLGSPTGVNVGALSAAAGEQPSQALSFTVLAKLPGSVTSSNGTRTRGGAVEWSPSLGQVLSLAASTRSWNTAPVVAAFVVAVLVVVALVLGCLQVVRRPRRRRDRRSGPAHLARR